MVFAWSSSVSAAEWKPVDPAELALKTPKIQKDADAEAIFWDIRVQDEGNGLDSQTFLSHYLRVKVFTERGCESQGKVEIPSPVLGSISDISGRTIQPDGKILELQKDGIFESTIVKARGFKVKATTFVMPGVVPGSIVEYRWRETHSDLLFLLARRLVVQRDIPIWLVQYHIKPLPSELGSRLSMMVQRFHCPEAAFVRDPNGFHSLSLRNIPAFRPEPQMPPENQVRGWMLLYYLDEKGQTPETIWRDYGRESYKSYRARMKETNEIRKAAQSVVSEASSPLEKLERLDRFCRSRVKNADYESSRLTAEERAKTKENKFPGDTLKRGIGTGREINLLFATLATAAGFEARLARVGDRGDFFFDRRLALPGFLNASDVAVRVGSEWRFFDPATPYLPRGMLRWQEEGQEALICDDEPQWVSTPLAGPDQSATKRRGNFRLTADGTLEGEVTVQYTGHSGAAVKRYYDDGSSEPEREQHLREFVKERLSVAELRDIRFENVTDSEAPISYSYHIRVPGYAQSTGRRLLVQPAFFQHGVGPLFSTSGRTHQIYFHYPWSEQDEVQMELPPGFSLDNAESPSSSPLGQVGEYSVKLAYAPGERKLIYTRRLRWGLGGAILFPADKYPQLKALFDFVHQSDNHTVALKRDTGRSQL